MSKLEKLRVFINECLTATAVEIFGAVEKTVAEYQEENDHLRRMLRISPELQLCKIDCLQFSLALSEEEVPLEQQNCEQTWSLCLGQEDPEPRHIKEEQEELMTSQEEGQLQWLLETKDSLLTSCVKTGCDQENRLWTWTEAQTKTEENRECYSTPLGLKRFETVTDLNCYDIATELPDNDDFASNHGSAVSSGPVGLPSSSPLDLRPPLDIKQSMERCSSKLSTTSKAVNCCNDCGKIFALKADLQRHMTFAKKSLSECRYCKRCYNSSCKLKTHIQLCHNGKPCTCPFCGRTFKQKGNLSRHMRIHIGEKSFSCLDCGKSYNCKEHLTKHRQIHTGEKPFSCGECGKHFSRKEHLSKHEHIHKGEKPFNCGNCGKSFNRKGNLNLHIRTHTGEKLHSCLACGKRFTQKTHLLKHVDKIHIEKKNPRKKKMVG